MGIIENLEKMLNGGQDNAMLRFGLGNAYYQQHDFHRAIPHLEEAVRHDPDYSAAWKLLGKSLTECKENDRAVKAFKKGITCAEKRGDIQAVKEMKVFLKRLHRGASDKAKQ